MQNTPFVKPTSIIDGLAVYSSGVGETILLFPYPHSHTTAPMALSPLAASLRQMNRTVVTFDVPGAYQSIREPVGTMEEMFQCADETLSRLGSRSMDVVGHSMGGLSSLAYTIERPSRVRRLVLVNSLSGFPAAARWGLPGSEFSIYQLDYWRIVVWGIRLTLGRGNLEMHKRLANLIGRVSYYNKSLYRPIKINKDDYKKEIPIHTIWSRNMYTLLDYADKLEQVQVPTLVLAARHDVQTPLACAQELLGIPNATLVVFEHSGHCPFIEEPELFAHSVSLFLNDANKAVNGNLLASRNKNI